MYETISNEINVPVNISLYKDALVSFFENIDANRRFDETDGLLELEELGPRVRARSKPLTKRKYYRKN